MHAYAQTNVQLFNQLRSEGYSKEDRERVREAYEFAMRLFTGMFLPSGKSFIDHLVGTASVLASLRVRVELIIAGLIHAAYLHGNFGGVRKGISDATRRQVQSAVGPDVEKYVVRYELMPWDPSIFPRLHDNIDNLDPLDRDVLLMRLANDFEHNLDLGSLYRDNWYRYIKQYGSAMISMAEKLGFPSLSAEMAQVFKDIVSTQLPLEPRIATSEPAAYLVVPKSYHEPFWVVYWPKARRFGADLLNPLRQVCRRGSTLIRGLFRAGSSSSKPKVSA